MPSRFDHYVVISDKTTGSNVVGNKGILPARDIWIASLGRV
ncbi:hypothetical protein M7I_7973 [Glarea lozoyensis 74030]|uniref:Uncharacterized protein n=1 Tax=Glarea lozoyensis (strain ATCC 74030 / MF5533) TaxID=1104152 RepID=H0EYR5_GLAL7|nr:hypothetical protein M7I_7973 [Glarea lozoyensis 74030]